MGVFDGAEIAVSQTSTIGVYAVAGTILVFVVGAISILGFGGLRRLRAWASRNN